MGQVTAVAEIHTHDGIARFQQSQIHRHIGLGTGVRLDVGMLGSEELFGPLDGEILHLVHILAAAIVARTGKPFGVFVCEMAAHGLHHGGRNKVFRRDQLDMIPLASQFAHHGAVYLGVLCFDMLVIHGVSS